MKRIVVEGGGNAWVGNFLYYIYLRFQGRTASVVMPVISLLALMQPLVGVCCTYSVKHLPHIALSVRVFGI